MRVLALAGNHWMGAGVCGALQAFASGRDVVHVTRADEIRARLTQEDGEILILAVASLPAVAGTVVGALAGLRRPPRVLALAPEETPDACLLECFERGWGLLLESAPPDLLRIAVETLAAGEEFTDYRLFRRLRAADREGRSEDVLRRLDPDGVLPPRCRQPALLALQGYTDEQIGERLNLRTRTIGDYLSAAYAALGIDGRRGLRELRDAPAGPTRAKR